MSGLPSDNRCGCGNEGRYMIKKDDTIVMSCNKYERCPDYGELYKINVGLQTELQNLKSVIAKTKESLRLINL